MDIGNIFNILFDFSLQWFQSLIYLYKIQEVKFINQEIVFEVYINLVFKNKVIEFEEFDLDFVEYFDKINNLYCFLVMNFWY